LNYTDELIYEHEEAPKNKNLPELDVAEKFGGI
jgi:hypothetical protein